METIINLMTIEAIACSSCYRLLKLRVMELKTYELLREKKAYDALWIELLNASGFAGVLPNGEIVDRRYYPKAIPVQKNSVFGVVEPKKV